MLVSCLLVSLAEIFTQQKVKTKVNLFKDRLVTDFTAKLVEVRKDGYARIIQDGILRTRFRESKKHPQLMTPGNVYRIEVDMGYTSIQLPAGSKLRLDISSSNFPKYTPNNNVGDDVLRSSKLKKAQQTIYFSKEYSSHLLLPVQGK